MRDSGVGDVIVVGVRDGSWGRAVVDGFDVFSISVTVGRADVVFVLLPDEIAPGVYESEVEPDLGR